MRSVANTIGHSSVYTPAATVQTHKKAFAQCDFEEEWTPKGHVTCSEVSPLFLLAAWFKTKQNKSSIKTGEEGNSRVRVAVGSSASSGKPHWATCSKLPVLDQTTRDTLQEGIHFFLRRTAERKTMCHSEGKQRAPLWMKEKCLSDWGKLPLFLLPGARGRYALQNHLTQCQIQVKLALNRHCNTTVSEPKLVCRNFGRLLSLVSYIFLGVVFF